MKPSAFLYLLFFVLIGLATTQCTNGKAPVEEGYEPDKPIEFPHDIHAGKNGIDCKFCHNAAFDEKNTGISSADICMKCHKEVKGNPAQRSGK